MTSPLSFRFIHSTRILHEFPGTLIAQRNDPIDPSDIKELLRANGKAVNAAYRVGTRGAITSRVDFSNDLARKRQSRKRSLGVLAAKIEKFSLRLSGLRLTTWHRRVTAQPRESNWVGGWLAGN